MKYFSTGFFLKKGVVARDVINECLAWISSSPHTEFIPAQLDMKRNLDSFDVEVGSERIDLINFQEESLSMYCFRYSKIGGAHKWITDIAVNEYKEDGSLWIQVESSVITQQAAYKAPDAKTPLIVMILLDKFNGSSDSVFNVGVDPVILENDAEGLDMASSFINSEIANRLPVVYVSSKYYYREHAHNVIPERLARKLAGLAHVVVEPPGSIFSNKLKNRVNSKNSYGGSVGIYWPRGQGVSVHRRDGFSASEFEGVIIDEIMTAMTSLVPLNRCGWTEIANNITRKSIQKLREDGSSSDDLIALYEEDNENYREEIRSLQQKLASSEARVRYLNEKSSVQGGIFISLGDEYDLFDGEIKEILITSLKNAMSSNYEKSRFHDVISSIISSNDVSSLLSENDAKLKQAMTGYKSMTPKIKSVLTEIGFSINDDGKHWKMTYCEDPRYTYVLPKSGSDYRGSLNAYSDITRKVFS